MLFGATAAEEHAGIARNGKWECGKLERGFAQKVAWKSLELESQCNVHLLRIYKNRNTCPVVKASCFTTSCYKFVVSGLMT